MACGDNSELGIVPRREIMEETLASFTIQAFIVFGFIQIVFQRWSLFTTMEVQKIL